MEISVSPTDEVDAVFGRRHEDSFNNYDVYRERLLISVTKYPLNTIYYNILHLL